MKIRIISTLCPKCGAAVQFCEKDRVIKCFHCDMDFIPDHAQGIERYYFEPQMKDPRLSVYHFLNNKGIKRTDYRVIDVDTLYFPVWGGSGQVTGWIAGLSPIKTSIVTETVATPSGGHITVRRNRRTGGFPLKKLINIKRDMLFNAVTFQNIRWRKEQVTKTELESFMRVYNEENMSAWGKILTPDNSPYIQKNRIRQKFIATCLSFYIDYKPLRHRLKVIGQRTHLYYFPLALVKVKLNNQLLFFTVNGISGSAISDKPLEKQKSKTSKHSLLFDTTAVFLSAIFSASLITSSNLFTQQIGIAAALLTIFYIWIKQ